MVKGRVNPSYFSDNYKFLYECAVKQVGKELVLDSDILDAYLSTSEFNSEQKTEIKILFSACREQTVSLEKLEEIIPAFINEVSTIKLSNNLMMAGQILTSGIKQGKIELKGVKDAKNFLIKNVAGLQDADGYKTPQGSIQESTDRFWEQYNAFEKNPHAGLYTGFEKIDKMTGGFRKGELVTCSAHSGEGKSVILRNWIYHASVFQKKNVVLFTLEMPFDQINNQLMSMHSLHPKFKFKTGLNVRDIDDARLSADDKKRLEIVVDDFKNNDQYGILYLKQLPHQSMVNTIREDLLYLNSMFPIHGVFIDYSGLLKAEYMRPTVMAEFSNIYNEIKLLGLDFNGEGVPIISAWQISRSARQDAEKLKEPRYSLGYLAEASAIERASDWVFWSLFTEEMRSNHELKMGVSKARRGPLYPDWWMLEQFQYSKLSDMETPIIPTELMGDTSLTD